MTRADFEPAEVQAFLRCCETHDVVLDIGANVGFYSCLAASRDKRVIAFEPAPRNLRFLYRNLWSNGFSAVEVFPVGLGRDPGLMPIYGFGGIASFVPGWAQASDHPAGLAPVTALDLVMANRFPGKRIFVKMDVEGFELNVLAGANGMLGRCPKPTWMLEIMLTSSVVPDGISQKFAGTFDVFWSHGYQCTALGPKEIDVTPASVGRWIRAGGVEAGMHNFLFSSQ
ncbi:MAG: FkbM family methyltransferase [Terracidiphilus sp.]